MILDEARPRLASTPPAPSPSEDATLPPPTPPPGFLDRPSASRPSMRIRPGMRFSALPVPSSEKEIKLESFDGPYQLSEYLGRLIAQEGTFEGKGVDRLVSVPGEGQGDAEDWVDADVWLYEHLLRLPPDLTPLITSLLACCTPKTCPDMRAGEWQYLCAAHPKLNVNKDCAAIDYILHALDSITSMLNSSRVFPSRLSIPPTSRQNLKNIARRMSRIFGHAYSFHREVFEACEEETSLYRRFLALSTQYALVDDRELAIPSGRFTTSSPATSPPPLDASSSDPAAEAEEQVEWGTRANGSARGTASKRTVKEFDIGLGSSQDDEDDDSPGSSSSDEEDGSTNGSGVAGEGRADTISRGLSHLSLSPTPPGTSIVPPTSPAPSPQSQRPPIPKNTSTKTFLGSPILLSSPPSSTKTSPVNVTAVRSPSTLSPNTTTTTLVPPGVVPPGGKRTRTTTPIKSPGAGAGLGANIVVSAGGKSIGRSAGGRLVKAGTVGRGAGGKGLGMEGLAGMAGMKEGGWREGREEKIE